MASTFSTSSLLATLRAAGYAPGQRVEFAAISPRRGILALWVDVDQQGLELAAGWLSAREGQQNLYLLANPLKPESRKRRAKRAEDRDCASTDVLLLDVDPVKVRQGDVDKGKAAQKDLDELGVRPEKIAAADEIAAEVRAFLQARLGVSPPLVSSGRGRQIWLRIAGEFCKRDRRRFVRALAKRFDRGGLATLDPATYNVARLMRLPGSRNLRTGCVAEVLDAGDGLRAKAADVLALVEELDPPKPKRKPRSRRPGGSAPPGQPPGAPNSVCRTESALEAIPADDYETWVAVGMALASSDLSDAYGLWDRWSATSSSYEGQAETAAKWKSFSAGGGTTMGTLFHAAIENGWTPPAPTRDEEQLLPLLDTTPQPRSASTPAAASELVRSVARPRKRKRGDLGPVVQDRRPTGSGKTTSTARVVSDTAKEDGGRFLWASPSHDLARLEVLPALAKAGAAIWDEDLDGTDGNGVRARLLALGATVLPLGEPPGDPCTPIAVKLSPFACPGPVVGGWTSESVEQLYGEAAARGWNPTATVCRACPRFLSDNESAADPCTYWERRRLAAKADVLVVPHHALKCGSAATRGRSALVIDEDPSGALVKRLLVDGKSARAFLVLVEAAVEHVAAEVQRVREDLEQVGGDIRRQGQLPALDQVIRRSKLVRQLDKRERLVELVLAQADAVEAVLAHVLAALDGWRSLPGEALLDVYECHAPRGIDLSGLGEIADLGRACEHVLRQLAKAGEDLADSEGDRVGSARNLLPFLRQLSSTWESGAPAVLHTKRLQGGGLGALVAAVERLPGLPTLSLDATGDPRLLSLATGREVALVEGELTGKLAGVHLADVPCGRSRWRRGDRRARRGGRTGSEAIDADIDAIARYARRQGASRVGLVTFKFVRDEFAAELTRRANLEVRALHYGGEVGSNAFEGWADLVVVAGTPFVPPEEIRLRATLEGAGVEELLTPPEWQRRRLPGGGTVSILVQPGEATQRAYSALVCARLEQSLGRAMRWDWVPPCGVLVLAEPWSTRHPLKITTRRREALDGPVADVYELALADGFDQADSEDPLTCAERFVRHLILRVGGAAMAAKISGVSERSVRRWISGECLPTPDRARSLANKNAGVASGIGHEPGSKNGPGIQKRTRDPNSRSVSQPLVSLFRTPPLRVHSLRGGVLKSDTSKKNGPGFKKRTWIQKTDLDSKNGPGTDSGPEALKGNDVNDPRKMTTGTTAELVEEALQLAGGKTRLLGIATGFSAVAIRRWRNGSRKPGSKSVAVLKAFVALRTPGAPGRVVTDRRRAETSRDSAVRAILSSVGDQHRPPPADELVEVPAGSEIPGMGKIYAPASVPHEIAAGLSPAPPPEPTKREEVARGLEELRGWADPAIHPGWLRRAASRGKGLGSFATWLGTRRTNGMAVVDRDLALERAQGMQCELSQPIYARRLWGHSVALLLKRGAQPRGENVAKPACKACGGSRKNSKGRACLPCKRDRERDRAAVRSARYAARKSLELNPVVVSASEVLEAKPAKAGRAGADRGA